MKTLMAQTPVAPQLDDDMAVPDELIGRLHRATATTILDLLDRFTPQERANLAMFCYRKAHLHRIGLAIAATCDLPALVQQWGTVLGHAIFIQSREKGIEPETVRQPQRQKITLARAAGPPLPFIADLEPELEHPPEPELVSEPALVSH
jgi:hypothetical protein